MKKILAVAMLVASAAVMPVATPAFASTPNDRLCGPDGPEAYKRPGGYCEQIGKKGSLNESTDCDIDIAPLAMVAGDRMLVAYNCYALKRMVS